MSERIQRELAMLRECWPDLEYREEGRWVRIAGYRVPDGIWNANEVDTCFQIPEQLPGQAPYGFYVRPELRLQGGGAAPQNYQSPAETPFGGAWGRFSWQLEPWHPHPDPRVGSNMVNFVLSFSDRLREGA